VAVGGIALRLDQAQHGLMRGQLHTAGLAARYELEITGGTITPGFEVQR
jgi:hypothetical protein